MSNIDEANKAFIDTRVNPILEKLVLDLLLKKPESVCDYMLEWIKNQGKAIEKGILEAKNDGKHRVLPNLICRMPMVNLQKKKMKTNLKI